jgi:hypothetical protein
MVVRKAARLTVARRSRNWVLMPASRWWTDSGFTVAAASSGLPLASAGTPFRLMPPDLKLLA